MTMGSGESPVTGRGDDPVGSETPALTEPPLPDAPPPEPLPEPPPLDVVLPAFAPVVPPEVFAVEEPLLVEPIPVAAVPTVVELPPVLVTPQVGCCWPAWTSATVRSPHA